MNLAELKNYLVDGLQGSCISFYEMVDCLSEKDEKLFYENEVEILEYIDNHIFECACCSWWSEIADAHDDAIGEVICGQCMGED